MIYVQTDAQNMFPRGISSYLVKAGPVSRLWVIRTSFILKKEGIFKNKLLIWLLWPFTLSFHRNGTVLTQDFHKSSCKNQTKVTYVLCSWNPAGGPLLWPQRSPRALLPDTSGSTRLQCLPPQQTLSSLHISSLLIQEFTQQTLGSAKLAPDSPRDWSGKGEPLWQGPWVQ